MRKYEIKMLVRMDKEFSDITYRPTKSLGAMMDNLCKRTPERQTAENKSHGRPYYNHEETIALFDKQAAKF